MKKNLLAVKDVELDEKNGSVKIRSDLIAFPQVF
jgi:hypothetical protein